MTKFLSDSWMHEKGFVDETFERNNVQTWWSEHRVGDLDIVSPVTIGPDVSVKEAIALMNDHGFDMLPVQDAADGKVLGVITSGQLTAKLTGGSLRGDDACTKAMYKSFAQVTLSDKLCDVGTMLDKEAFTLVVANQRRFDNGAIAEKSVVTGVVTRIDLLAYIAKNEGSVEETA